MSKWFMTVLLLLFSVSASAGPTRFEKSILKQATGLDHKVLDLALKAYENGKKRGLTPKNILTIIDYSKPSNKKRFWVVDLTKAKLLYSSYVSHGENTGMVNATKFSDKVGSHQSSMGLFMTENPYIGSHGLSLRLKGLEDGVNGNAYSRAIVIHGAWYSDPQFVDQYGRTGRSWGCPAIETALTDKVIDTIKDGSLVFAYYPDKDWLYSSPYLV